MHRKIVFSDMHVAGGKENDDFLQEEWLWCAELQQEKNFYFAGDIYELLEGDSVTDCINAHLLVSRYLEDARGKGQYVKGNHDIDLREPEELDLPGGIRIVHGHQFDIGGKNSWFWRLISKISQTVARWLRLTRTPAGTPKSVRRLRDLGWTQKAFEYIDRHDLQVLVCGHTHLAGIWRQNGKCIINVGSWVDRSQAHYAQIDYYPTYIHISLVYFSENGPRIIEWERVML